MTHLKTVAKLCYFDTQDSDIKLSIGLALDDGFITKKEAFDAVSALDSFSHQHKGFREMYLCELNSKPSELDLFNSEMFLYMNREDRDFLFQDFIENY